MRKSTGVGVLDKSVAILHAVSARPLTLGELSDRAGVSRATAHRLAVALEIHGLLARTDDGRWLVGPLAGQLAAGPVDTLLGAAPPVLAWLRDTTGESAQLYRRDGDVRVCVAAAERTSGLRDTVPLGARLPLTAGSAAQVLLAFDPGPPEVPAHAAFTTRELAAVRRRGWAQSVAEREAGVASVSAPVHDGSGGVVAVVSVSGPLERLGRSPGRAYAAPVVEAATRLSAVLAA